MILENLTKKNVVASQVSVASSILTRLVGLLGRKQLHEKEGLLITPCKSIHTFFMRFPIDVIFISTDNHVIGMLHSFSPFRISKIYSNAEEVIELKSGVLKQKKVEEGDLLNLRNEKD